MLCIIGLCGNARLADIGGPPFLFPMVQRDKVSTNQTISYICRLSLKKKGSNEIF